MSDKMTKKEILDLLNAERERWEGLVSRLDSARLAAPALPGGWSIKDVIGHIAAWQQDSIRLLEAAVRDEPPEPPKWPENLDVDVINARIFAACQSRPPHDLLLEWRQGFQRMLDLVSSLPDSSLHDTGLYPWLNGESAAWVALDAYGHAHDEHWEPLQPWLREHGWI